MWTAQVIEERGGTSLRYGVSRVNAIMSYRQAIAAWQGDETFRHWFNELLAEAPFRAFRWETPGVTNATADQPFELAALASAELERSADPEAFAEHFVRNPSQEVLAFSNLGGDATLVVPAPRATNEAYGHLGAFVRLAPEAQRQRLWRTVGDAMAKRLSARPVWLSTAGAGVAWLHVRLDDRPKYYGYAPFRQNR